MRFCLVCAYYYMYWSGQWIDDHQFCQFNIGMFELNNANTIHIHADPQTLRIFPLETALLVAGAVAHTLVFWLFGLI